ncbi:hypothetical protein BSPA111_14360 [Buttiauxella sp. A111]|nr:hypothetical protein BSPA111_14360 [Buttiauxella sp. A111]
MATETPASFATSFIVAIESVPEWVSVYTILSVTEKARYFKGATVVRVAN